MQAFLPASRIPTGFALVQRICKHSPVFSALLAAVLVLVPVQLAEADRREWRNVGYSELRDKLGDELPTGKGVRVALVDAGPPDAEHREFEGKNIIYGPGLSEETPDNGHATTCGRIFFGNQRSMAPGIEDAEVWASQIWMRAMAAGSEDEELFRSITEDGTRVASHSYVSGINNRAPLVTIDRLVQQYDYLQVVGIPNENTDPVDLWGSAFNVITCGKTNGEHPYGTSNFCDVYAGGRAKPDIVGPLGVTSNTTPLTASVAALLVQMSQNDPRLSRGSYTSNSGQRIYHAGSPEVVRAVLMAAASRNVENEGHADITDWGQGENLLENGLDRRFGAGQLNAYQAHRILAAGEQEAQRTVARAGWAYERAFRPGETPTFFLEPEDHDTLQAVLAWHVDASDESEPALHILELVLWDATEQEKENWEEIDRAACRINNTQSVAMSEMEQGRRYALQVVATEGAEFETWPFALAWRLDEGERPDTEPPTIELHAPAWGNYLLGPTTIRADAEDNRPGVTVQFYLDGEPAGDLQREAPFELELEPGEFPGQRSVTVGATAIDAAGNETAARELRLQVVEDRRPPSVSVRDRARGDEITLNIRARDRYGLRQVRILLVRDGKDEPEELEVLEFEDGPADVRHEHVFHAADLPPGRHEIHVVAIDLAGNERVSTTQVRRR